MLSQGTYCMYVYDYGDTNKQNLVAIRLQVQKELGFLFK